MNPEVIIYLKLSSYSQETPNVEAIRVDWSYIEKRALKRADFRKMSNLIMLILVGGYQFTASLDFPDSLRYFYWPLYLLESLPSNFSPENLVELHMPNSKVKKLWKEEQILVNLQVIDLCDSEYLIEVPNLSGSLKIVEINLWGCKNLVEIPSYFQHLDKLTCLDLGACRSLNYLPKMPGNITYLCLQNTGIKELPESVWSNKNISYLNIHHCKDLEKLPSNRCKMKVSDCFNLDGCTSLGEFFELPKDITTLSLVDCKRLVSLPTNLCKLKYVEQLNLSWCSKLEDFPKILKSMEHMKSLNLSGTAVKELHSSIEFLPALKRIYLVDCKRLSSIPKSICKLKCLEELDLSWCSKLENFPEILESMEHMKFLNLSGTAVKKLHSSIKLLPALKSIYLEACERFSSIPQSICKLKYLERLDLENCSRFSNFPEILKPMKHLVSLSLQGIAVKMLPSSFENLFRLQTLDLSGCKHLKDVPDCLFCSSSLEELNLSGPKIRSIPASIKHAYRLSILNLVDCKRLQSLPELPVLCNVEVQGCTSLKTVSSTRTAPTQGWVKRDDHEFEASESSDESKANESDDHESEANGTEDDSDF